MPAVAAEVSANEGGSFAMVGESVPSLAPSTAAILQHNNTRTAAAVAGAAAAAITTVIAGTPCDGFSMARYKFGETDTSAESESASAGRVCGEIGLEEAGASLVCAT